MDRRQLITGAAALAGATVVPGVAQAMLNPWNSRTSRVEVFHDKPHEHPAWVRPDHENSLVTPPEFFIAAQGFGVEVEQQLQAQLEQHVANCHLRAQEVEPRDYTTYITYRQHGFPSEPFVKTNTWNEGLYLHVSVLVAPDDHCGFRPQPLTTPPRTFDENISGMWFPEGLPKTRAYTVSSWCLGA